VKTSGAVPAIRAWLALGLVAGFSRTHLLAGSARDAAPAGGGSVSLCSMPAEIFLGGGILLPVRVNGSGPLWFALDSAGGSGYAIEAGRAASLGLVPFEHGLSTGAGEEPVPFSLARSARIELPGVTIDAPQVALLSLRPLEPFSGHALDGILGFGLFSSYVVEIDYEARRVSLYAPEGFVYSGDGAAVPLEVEKNHFFIGATVVLPGRKPLPGRFLIDTGAPTATLILSTPFVRRHRLRAEGAREYVDRSIPGLGGETAVILSRASEVDVAGFRIRRMTLALSQDKAGSLASSEFDGIVGGELLRRFHVVFDVRRRRLFLRPNGAFREPYEHNMSGLGLRAEGEGFRIVKIHRVIPGSAADSAGLREGDEIRAIDGRPAAEMTLDGIYRLLRQEGRSLLFATVRAGQRRTVKLILRRLA
jgi:hypothetical protein